MNPSTTPAYINNNPLNMRPLPHGETWQGQIGVSNYAQTGSFCRFVTPAKGVRAATINMRSIVRLGRRTLEQMINTWAPPGPDQSAGIVSNYLNHVCTRSNLPGNYDLGWLLLPDPSEKEVTELAAIIKGMNEFEAGGSTVSEEDIAIGIDDALQIPHGYVRQDDGNIMRADVGSSETMRATNNGLIGTVATIGSGVAVPLVSAVVGAPPITVAILVGAFLLAACGVAVFFLLRARNERVKMNVNGIA